MDDILLLGAANRGNVKYSTGTSNSNFAEVLSFELLQVYNDHFNGDFAHHWEAFYGNVMADVDDE